jgi:hypothetical protein
MLPFINPLPILITFAALFGVLFHDTQFDHAATAALITPVTVSDFGSIETALRLNDVHIHTERTSVSTSQPGLQTRGSEDKKYIVQKRLISSNADADYHWPVLA